MSIPFTVIGGYLGSGKTTLLNHLLRQNDDRRLAVLVNDFGDINIDAELIISHDGETMQLANGCICCSIADNFVRTLGELRSRADQLDHIVIEASGVANPTALAHYAVALQFDLDGVIVVVDAEQIRERAVNKYVGETVIRQLKAADLLIVNKADLVGATEMTALRDWLRAIAGDVPIIETSYGQVDPLLLAGFNRRDDLAGLAPGGEESDHASLYETVSFTSETPLDEARFERWAEALSPDVVRAKGLVFFDSAPDQPQVYQRVGRRWTITPAAGSALLRFMQPLGSEYSGPTRIVLIGLPGSVDAAQLAAALRE